MKFLTLLCPLYLTRRVMFDLVEDDSMNLLTSRSEVIEADSLMRFSMA